MAFIFEELDAQDTELGTLSLRRRAEPRLNGEILYEVKLGEEFLMSSLFTDAEIALSKLGLEALKNSGHSGNLDIVVGGLGLGYTALEVLQNDTVSSLTVIELMPAVISWHQQGILPIGDILYTDSRSELKQADFFEAAISTGFFPDIPKKKAHAVLLDIDHSPSFWLDPKNSAFYTTESLQQLIEKLHPGGIFGLWSDELPDDDFTGILETAFDSVEAHTIRFHNPLSDGESVNSVYLATKER